jgi:hypothetical protein
MNSEQHGSFRTRTSDDGSLEVWARGWRLESQLYALAPMGLALMFLLAPMSLPMRVLGAVVMLGATLLVFRMTKPGLRLTHRTLSIVSIARTQRFDWDEVAGFMGERGHDEARILLILADDRQIPLPGTLDPAELDPYGDEGQELSAADQLNLLKERAVKQDLPRPSAPVERAPEATSDHPTRKERRRERSALRAALKGVRLTPEGEVASVGTPDDDRATPPRRRRRSRREPVSELEEVAIDEPEPVSAAPPVRTTEDEPAGRPSHFPAPVYIPQAEYAQMLRDQRAAEKAAAEAAAELRRLAYLEEPEDLRAEGEPSDRTSERPARSAG